MNELQQSSYGSIETYQERIEHVLTHTLTNKDTPERLAEAIRYSVLGGGKRIRALLVYAAGEAFAAPVERLDAVATALECIHAYSLIHDDLPAMDDDELRRGKPTNHIQFDEATAILAGDALQALAFEVIADAPINDSQARIISKEIALCAGRTGMVGGQMLDIQATEQAVSLDELEAIHRSKTGALIQAAVICGAVCSDVCQTRQLNHLTTYAQKLGLAFQVVDDILDIESSTEELGKPSGSDQALGKSTYPQLIGLQESKKLAQTLYHETIESLDQISDNTGSPLSLNLLKELAKLVVKRTN